LEEVADFKSESAADFISESMADLHRNQQAPLDPSLLRILSRAYGATLWVPARSLDACRFPAAMI
jgi:hypothetical protein